VLERRERLRVEHCPQGADEELGVLARRHESDALRVIGIDVENPIDLSFCERDRDALRVAAPPEIV
jgi:hypothetical protein